MAEKQYIDREAVIKYLSEVKSVCTGNYEDETADNLSKIIREISDGEIPSADVAPVKHGEWEGRIHDRFYGTDEDGEPIYRDGVVYYCSECRHRSIIKTSFCPNCGAKMDGDR